MKTSIFAFRQGPSPFCKSLPFPPSRQVSPLCRPISPSNSHHRHHFPPGYYLHRNGYSTISPLESPDESPGPRFIKVSNIPAPHLGHIRVLKLNSPKTKNALSLSLLRELRLEIKLVKDQKNTHNELGLGPTRVLIVASELNVFCAGAHSKVMEATGEIK